MALARTSKIRVRVRGFAQLSLRLFTFACLAILVACGGPRGNRYSISDSDPSVRAQNTNTNPPSDDARRLTPLAFEDEKNADLQQLQIPEPIREQIMRQEPRMIPVESKSFKIEKPHLLVSAKNSTMSFTGVLKVPGRADENIELRCTFDKASVPWSCGDMFPTDENVAKEKRLQGAMECTDTFRCNQISLEVFVLISGQIHSQVFYSERVIIRRARSGDVDEDVASEPSQNGQTQTPEAASPPIQSQPNPQPAAPPANPPAAPAQSSPSVSPNPPTANPPQPVPTTPRDEAYPAPTDLLPFGPPPPSESIHATPPTPRPSVSPRPNPPQPVPQPAPLPRPAPAPSPQPAPQPAAPASPPANPSPAPPPAAVEEEGEDEEEEEEEDLSTPEKQEELRQALADPNQAVEVQVPIPPPAPVEGRFAIQGIARHVSRNEAAPEQAVGRHNGGHLKSPKALPNSGKGFVSRGRQNRSYGTDLMMDLLALASAKTHDHAPQGAPFTIANISQQTGGRLCGDRVCRRNSQGQMKCSQRCHSSHQTGLDVDVFYPVKNSAQQLGQVCSAVSRSRTVVRNGVRRQRQERSCPSGAAIHANFDTDRFWTFAKNFFMRNGSCAHSSPVIALFVDEQIKQHMCRYAKRLGENLSDPNSCAFKTLQAMKHQSGHHDHVHFRLKCPGNRRCINAIVTLGSGTGC